MTKGNDGTGNIEARDNWETPQWLFDQLHEQYNFQVDCCATKENSKCILFCTDFLISERTKHISPSWMNPPFSKARKMFERFFNMVKKGVAIYRCDNMETKIWGEVILKNADWIFMPNKRWAYEGHTGKGSRFPSALIGIGVEPPKELEGHTLTKSKESK